MRDNKKINEIVNSSFKAGLIFMSGVFFLIIAGLYFFFDMSFGEAKNTDMCFGIGIGILLMIIGGLGKYSLKEQTK